MPVIKRLYKLPQIREWATVEDMETTYERLLNPCHYPLTKVGKKRLRWMYIIEYECAGNVSAAALKIGVSRVWLSQIYNTWKKQSQNPLSLEPKSRAPHHTSNRKRISEYTKEQIITLRKKYPCFGKEKIAAMLQHIPKAKACPTTVNNYLSKARLLNVRLSEKNRLAYKNKTLTLKQRVRPPSIIKDLKPGALVEKDMKFIVKTGVFRNTAKHKARENFWYQHTEIDSFTRIRTLELTEDAGSKTSAAAHRRSKSRFPFAIACINSDSGSENGLEFEKELEKDTIVHFHSRTSTPTDNPRVERSHLTDEVEFYGQGNIHKTFEEQKAANASWERFYNYDRPHQALSYLSPMQFYALWKKDPEAAYVIVKKYQAYLARQRRRQASARRMRKKESIEALMLHIDTVLSTDSNN